MYEICGYTDLDVLLVNLCSVGIVVRVIFRFRLFRVGS